MNMQLAMTVMASWTLFACQLWAQGSQADYDRAADLRQRTRDRVFRDRVEPQWIDGSPNFWYRVKTGKDSFEFAFVDVAAGTRLPAFDHEKLAHAIATSTDLKANASRLPISDFKIDGKGRQISFELGGGQWSCDLATYELNSTSTHADSDGNTPQDSLQSLTSIPRSSGQGEDTYVQFINKLDETVKLYWVAGDGSRRFYADIAAGKEHEQHTYGGHVWLVTTKAEEPVAVFRARNRHSSAVIDGSVEIEERRGRGKSNRRDEDKKDVEPDLPRGQRSPDGEWIAYIQDHNLFMRRADSFTLDDDSVVQLSTAGTEEDPFLSRRLRWSPDSRKLVAIQERIGETREVHMVESSPKDQLQPKLHTMVYAKPGDKLPVARPRLFDVESQKQVDVSDELFPNAWSISSFRWRVDSQRFTFLYNQRGHQILRIISVDAKSGEATAIVNEESQTFIDYAYKAYTHYLDDTNELIWMSERDGWNHLYLYDAQVGEVKNQITKGPWVVRGIERVDDDQRRVYFRASGVYPEQDPYYIHYGFVDFDGSNLTFLTDGEGTHKIEYTPDGEHLIDRYSRVDQPTITELRQASDGELVCQLERGDMSQLLDADWQTPERFVAKARDGETDIYGVIYRPTNFDETKTYPVIEKIYAGPHGSFVPKSFAPYRRAQSYAELGFIVVQIDGMGTSNRSKAFHNVAWKNIGDSGFPDRILWMQAAAEKYPQIDISRVGIFGGSAGGQSTLRALLAHGDFYDVGVADCGCHDNRMDKVWWNELWMGWPIGPHYEEQSNVTQAHRLTGKLLLTVGELDRNVDPASTMQVVNALINADKDFDFLIVPGAGHGVGESPYANRRRQDFFVRHLLGVDPRH